MSGDIHTPSENELIEVAYAATLDPTRLKDFERFWEAYIDAQLQVNPHGLNLDNTPVNAHIKIALDILGRLKVVQEQENIARQMVNNHYGFGLIVESNGRIVVANDTAELYTKKHTRFQDLPLDEESHRNIRSWMKEKPRKKADQFKMFDVHLNGQIGKRWLLSPIKIYNDAKGKRKRYFLITSVDTEIDLKLDPHIANFFSLTLAEAAVAVHLCTGMKPKEIARKRGVKITAVRTQIVEIKVKTGARDIPDIVRVITTVAIRSKAVKSQLNRMEALLHKDTNTYAHARESSFVLRDDRCLQYFEQGNPDGTPILQIHSLTSGIQFHTSHGRKLGSEFRLISPARPGYGKSDPHTINSLNGRIDSCVDDLRQLLDHLGVKKVYLLTGWSGAIAQRFALKYPSRCYGLVLSGAVPVWQVSYLSVLQPRYRNMVKTSIHAPKAVPYLVRVAKALIDSGRAHLFISDLDAAGSNDKKALENKEVYDCVVRRFKFLVEQGVDAFVDDLPFVHTDWTHDARRLKLPVTILMGSENNDQPREAIDRYRAAVPQAKLKMIEGAGSYQNLTHFEDVVIAIGSMPKR